MRIDNDIDLFKYSTMRTHSIATIMYTPHNVDELIEAINQCNKKCYYLSGGSNVVFASRVNTPIINLTELDNTLRLSDSGNVVAGCSVRIQKLINYGKDNAMGGFEYLYSLPACVGGIIYMNAGRGKVHCQQISDWLVSVDYLDLSDMVVKTMKVDKSQWSYRCSPFHQMNAVILSATFSMEKSTVENVYVRIQDRLMHVKENQEGNKPSCGSVFNSANRYLMWLIRGKRIGGACFSKKTNNWISNDQNGTADDVIALMEYAKRWHKRLGLTCIPEIRVFI